MGAPQLIDQQSRPARPGSLLSGIIHGSIKVVVLAVA